MCYKPINIDVWRVQRYFSPNAKSYGRFVKVPCGHCEECARTYRNDMYLRTLSEYDNYVNNGGKVAFLTFTYRENPTKANLPTIPKYYYDDSDSDAWFYCVDKNHFKNYNKVVRKTLERLGLPGYRYLWCTEYGTDERFTQRIHYHALFFLPKVLVDSFGNSESAILEFFSKYWKYGRVSASKLGLFAKSHHCAEYVAKYAYKQVGFYENPRLKRYFAYKASHGVDYKTALTEIRSVLPYRTQSKFFGADMVSYYNNLDDISLFESLNNGIDKVVYGKTVTLSVPMYIKRKLLYDVRPDYTFALNERGRKYKDYNLKKRIDDKVNSFDKLKYDFVVSSSLLKKYSMDLVHLRAYVHSILDDDRLIHAISEYICLLRGRVVCPTALEYCNNVDDYINLSNYEILQDCEIFTDDYDHYSLHSQSARDYSKNYPLGVDFINCDYVFGDISSMAVLLESCLYDINEQSNLYFAEKNKVLKENKDILLNNKFI